MTRRWGDDKAARGARERRLADALKANLVRRKKQGRERAAAAPVVPGLKEASSLGGDANRTEFNAAGNTDDEESS